MHLLYLAYKAIKMNVADIREVMPHCVVQVIQSYYKHLATHFPSFLGREVKVSQSRRGSLQKFWAVNLSSIKSIYI